MRREIIFLLFFTFPAAAQEAAGSQASLAQVLQRMDALERENHELLQEIRALRQEVEATRGHPAAAPASPSPPQSSLQDRVTVNEHRIAEQAQTKVEASQKFPISLNGMLLFNTFANTGAGSEDASEYGLLAGPNSSGATIRQTLLGLEFQGPALRGGGRVNGSVMMDFWGGSSIPSAGWLRLRRAGISLDWENRSVFVGQDKPLISPFQPDSLAEVGIPPLAGAGNLWVWLPQARYEERIQLGESSGFTAQAALMQTGETYETVPMEYSSTLESARPALETRFSFWHKFDDVRRVEFGSGFHTSTTHVAGASVPSYVGSLDWKIVPFSKLNFTGTVYTGQNVASLGALGNGFTIFRDGTVRPVSSSGGWGQLSFPFTERLTLNLFSGIESDRQTYLPAYGVVRNLTYASNVMYHIGPNVVVSLEALQTRTRSFSGTSETHNHYDLALGYLF